MRTLIGILTAALFTAASITAVPGGASASCAGTPVASLYAFTGAVAATEREGRVAHVTTDAGRQVIVRGTPSDSGATSVDRAYIVEARYEFHPLNDSSPFEDNACTATRQLSTAHRADSGVGLSIGLLVAGAAALLAGLRMIARWLGGGERPTTNT
jgi:hypothetical protein